MTLSHLHGVWEVLHTTALCHVYIDLSHSFFFFTQGKVFGEKEKVGMQLEQTTTM